MLFDFERLSIRPANFRHSLISHREDTVPRMLNGFHSSDKVLPLSQVGEAPLRRRFQEPWIGQCVAPCLSPALGFRHRVALCFSWKVRHFLQYQCRETARERSRTFLL